MDEFTEKCHEVDNLQERVRELERLVTQSQTREEMSKLQGEKAHLSPILKDPGIDNVARVQETTNHVKRAIIGDDPSDLEPSDSSSESDDDSEKSSTESSDEELRQKPVKKENRKTSPSRKQEADEDFSDDLNAKLLSMEPESDHDSDTVENKRAKRAARWKHCPIEPAQISAGFPEA
ncbi:hypothetical protein DFJ58DRAFT_724598 [Suillus subalutaceus]|uniref:uncharacterized protein n=1 Tax=Suillus subalutaceus TaxID=48586 RepID=UPI001B87E844|nr:uncharacterized protein DFJ58DRAFT_724598 [Suillus subalutaceus]KAG1865051.1 hypothetical protein DFJ58DRAFT_724598 [Suillus subalutaceus]